MGFRKGILGENGKNLMYSVIFTEEATKQFESIKAYIKHILLNEKATVDFETALRSKIETLKNEPHLFPFVNDSKRYRKMGVKNYIAIYFVNEQKKTVYITAVVYAGSNYLRKYK